MAESRTCEILVYLFIGCFSALCIGPLVSSEDLTWNREDTSVLYPLEWDWQPRLFQVEESVEHDSTPPAFRMDTARLTLVSMAAQDKGSFQLYAQVDVCWKCPLVAVHGAVIAHGKNVTVLMDTRWPVSFMVEDERGNQCKNRTRFKQYGEYTLYVDSQSETPPNCRFIVQHVGPDSNIPIYVAMGILAGLSLLWVLVRFIHRQYNLYRLPVVSGFLDTDQLVDSDLGTPTNVDGKRETTTRKPRLRSLDTFRGLSLVIMIFVNYHGGKYWFFKHSSWNGLTVADTVFPWFVFIMGTSIALAFRAQLRRGMRRTQLLVKVIRRTLLLFFFGLAISNYGKTGAVDVHFLRIPGVLQRLALCYFGVAILEVAFAKTEEANQGKWYSFVRDIVPYWPEWLVALALVIGHTCITFLLPLPDECPKGYLGPGGIQFNASYFNCTGGAAGFIDRWMFGDQHMYGHPTCKEVYGTSAPYDPEGALGTLTGVFLCFLGLQAGKILVTYSDWTQRVRRWLVWAVITGLIAGVLCKFSQNDGWIPVNKNLWSLSFVLALGSMAFLLLTMCYLAVDVFNLWGGAPFVYPGMNSIVVYICHEVFSAYFPVRFKVPSTHAAQLAMSMWGATFWVIVSALMYYQGVFVAI